MMVRRTLGVLLVSTASWALPIVPHVMTRSGTTTLYAGVMNRGLEKTREGATPQGTYKHRVSSGGITDDDIRVS